MVETRIVGDVTELPLPNKQCKSCGHTEGVDNAGLCVYGLSDPTVKTWNCACHCDFEGQIAGVVVTGLKRFGDSRGWLSEVWRLDDETFITAASRPQMGYVSLTRPGVVRGPHEHVEQSDFFVFLSGEVRLTLWDRNGTKVELDVGAANPVSVLVPPGIVHAYQNTSLTDAALVLNFPNRLYAGWKRSEAVDEIRHEDEAGSRFTLIEPAVHLDTETPSCPFCGSKPLIDKSITQPDGHRGAMHITHSPDCYLTLFTGAQTHAGSSKGWSKRWQGYSQR